MATLTFRERVIDGRPQLRRFSRLVRAAGLGALQWAWVREYQRRGSVHFHWLWERDGLERMGLLAPEFRRRLGRGLAQRWAIGGPLERLIVDSWSKAVGDDSEEFKRFQSGGIVEELESGDSGARYFGSYLGKHEQKTLPPGAENCGRWWALSWSAKPEKPTRGWLNSWPFAAPYATVFDKRKLDYTVSSELPTTTVPTRKKDGKIKHRIVCAKSREIHYQRPLRMPMV